MNSKQQVFKNIINCKQFKSLMSKIFYFTSFVWVTTKKKIDIQI